MKIQENIPLAPYTNFRVGGLADYFVEVKNIEELQEALQFAKEKNIPVAVLGGGMNVLVADAGFRGLMVRVAMVSLSVEDDLIVADAGCTMGQVVAAAQRAGLTGMEWAVGLPGTVGGAVYGNAGCFGGETADSVDTVTLLCHSREGGNPDSRVLDPRDKPEDDIRAEIKTIDKSYLNFSYRYSKLKDTGAIVVSAIFRLRRGSMKEIAAAMERIRQKSIERIKEQPLGAWTAGSTFKGVVLTPAISYQLSAISSDWRQGVNRVGYLSAGWLLERAGLKGYRIGDASFSAHHANFIINHGRATASDIEQLIKTAKRQVKEKFGIELEEEIRYIGFQKN